MTESLPEVIYLDYTMISTYQSCREKYRLSFLEDLRPAVTPAPLDFGLAWHAAMEVWWSRRDLELAKGAFVKKLAETGSALPISMDTDSQRSVERGLYLLEAYHQKYDVPHYEPLLLDGRPAVEIGFSIHLMDWKGIPVLYVGRIDALLRSKLDGRIYIREFKTTGQSLTQFMRQCRPNNQVTGYHTAAQTILSEPVAGTIWDATFLSKRKPSVRGDRWAQLGIDYEADFGTVTTMRSSAEVKRFLFEFRTLAYEICEHRFGYFKEQTTWPMSAPTACSMYGGCQFRSICETNGNTGIIESYFRKEKWEPWRGLDEEQIISA